MWLFSVLRPDVDNVLKDVTVGIWVFLNCELIHLNDFMFYLMYRIGLVR